MSPTSKGGHGKGGRVHPCPAKVDIGVQGGHHRCHHPTSGCHPFSLDVTIFAPFDVTIPLLDVTIAAAMSPFSRQDVKPGRKNVKPARQDVKPLALKVDINDLHALPKHRRWTFQVPKRAKVDMDLASTTRFWHRRCPYSPSEPPSDVHFRPERPIWLPALNSPAYFTTAILSKTNPPQNKKQRPAPVGTCRQGRPEQKL